MREKKVIEINVSATCVSAVTNKDGIFFVLG